MRIAVTGAFGYSGRYIAQRLLDAGHSVITLTNSLRRENPFGDRVAAFPFNFDNRVALAESLAGVDALINTYWVRFDHALFTHDEAVANTKTLFAAAKRAGVRRIVHISITNPDLHSALPYFRGKAELELALQSLGVSHCILRPTVLFGREDILINNLAWGLRHLPVFAVFGDGEYRLQPIHVDDLAAACVDQAAGSENQIINAIGPETFTYRGLVETVRATLSLIRPILSLPPEIAYLGCRALGIFTRDVVITRQEIEGLMEDRLYVDAPPLGATSLTHWIKANRQTLGLHYTSELNRRTNRIARYASN
jgi:NADH dehydrogenase